jgi:acetyl-CoA synthetase
MIKARIKAENPNANLGSYPEIYKDFSWEEVRRGIKTDAAGGVNIVYEAIDRWAEDPDRKNTTALIFDKNGEVRRWTYAQLQDLSSRWAALLRELGLTRGDRVFIFLPHSPEICFAMLGCARAGLVFCPLYPTLGFGELDLRIQNAEPRAFLTHPDMVDLLPPEVLSHVENLLFTEGPLPRLFRKEILVPERLPKPDTVEPPVFLPEESPFYLIYTSGSTGPPKGVVHAHRDMAGHRMTGRYVLDLNPGTILWTDGHPAWVTGTVYSTFAPWLCGATSVVLGDPFSASNWYRTLERHQVEVWYTTPMSIKRLMEAGEDLPTRYNLSHLRHMATVGEALAPEQFYWVRKNLRHSPHDTWWMSETGMICFANFPSMDCKPGSMGKPVPGITAAVLDEKGSPLPFLSMGELALKVPWPAMMVDIFRDEDRYSAYFPFKGWFSTGDMTIMDEEGYYYHQGRVDDLIKLGEKVIGPYEIEHILFQHPAVSEAAVISKSVQPSRPQLKAFIQLHKGTAATNRLNQEIKAFVKANLSPDTPLREVEFVDSLPKTSAGKLLRRVLRARELGLPTVDPSRMQD